MKAKDIEPGMVINGWDVLECNAAGMWTTPRTTEEWDGVVLLTLERNLYLDGFDVNGDEVWYVGEAPIEAATKSEVRRDWFRADEEVER